MGRRLNSYVHVQDETGGYAVFGPDDDVPEEMASKIGDHAWVTDSDDVDDDGIDDRAAGEVPPRGGKGSGQPEWLSFARENGIDVEDDEDRADIIRKCEEAGLVEPVE